MLIDENAPVVKYKRIDYSKRMIELFLSGKTKAINHAFYWEYSPQGNEYWYSIYQDRREIDDEGRAYLRWLTKGPIESNKAPYPGFKPYSKFDTETALGENEW